MKSIWARLPAGLNEQKTFAGGFFVRIVSLAVTFLSSIVLARNLGAEGYGVYAYVWAIITIVSLPAQAGMPTLVVRETARAGALKNLAKMKGIWSWANNFVLTSTVLLVLVGIVLGFVYRKKIDDVYLYTFFWGLALVPMIAQVNIKGAALRGLHFIVKGQIPELIIRPCLLVFLVILLPAVGFPLSPQLAMFLHLVAAVFAVIAALILLNRLSPASLEGVSPDRSESRVWFGSLLPLGMVVALQAISHQTDIIMLGVLRDEEDVGVYRVVVAGAALALFGLQLVSQLMAPKFAESYAKNNKVKLQRLATLAAFVSSLVTLPVVMVFVFWGEELLGLFFGREFVVGYKPLVVLTLGQMFGALFGSVGMLLSMSGNERYSACWLALSTVINVVLNALLIPLYGVVGAAFATAVSIFVWNFFFWATVLKRIGVDCSIFSMFYRAEKSG